MARVRVAFPRNLELVLVGGGSQTKIEPESGEIGTFPQTSRASFFCIGLSYVLTNFQLNPPDLAKKVGNVTLTYAARPAAPGTLTHSSQLGRVLTVTFYMGLVLGVEK